MSDTTVQPLRRLSYSIAQLAEATGLSYDEVRKAVVANEMVARYRGKKALIPVESAEAWLAGLPDKKSASAD